MWIDGLVSGEWMIARQDYDERLFPHQYVFEIGLRFYSQERNIKLSSLQVVGQVCRESARNPDLNIGQVITKDAWSMRQPIDFLSC
jgi:hypothetical protein